MTFMWTMPFAKTMVALHDRSLRNAHQTSSLLLKRTNVRLNAFHDAGKDWKNRKNGVPRWSRKTMMKSMSSSDTMDKASSHLENTNYEENGSPSRRAIGALLGSLLVGCLADTKIASAFTPPPPGFQLHKDKLDGYSFLYPEDWLPVTTTGNDVSYRSPFSIEENLFVEVSSPSSSKYSSVEDLGTPEQAAEATLKQYLEEFMSTRLGVRRDAEIVSSGSRIGSDGKKYYDIQTRVRSYASRNQLAVTQEEISEGIEMEWDRQYLTVLGVANGRLYQFRLQAPSTSFINDSKRLFDIAQSFQCKEI